MNRFFNIWSTLGLAAKSNQRNTLTVKKITQISLSLVAAIYSLLFSTIAMAGTPTFSVAFSPTTIAPGASSTMTYTIDNSANNVAVSQVGFTNTLPVGMTIVNPNSASTNCNNGNYTATAGSNSISFSDYRLGTGQSCTFSLKVTSSTAGAHVNTTGALTSSAGSSGTANATLTVDTARPGFSMAFSPATIAPGAVSRLTYTIDNTQNGSNVTLLTFTNSLPSGLVVSAFPNVDYTCGSISTLSVTAVAGSSSIAASLISANAGSSCTVSVDVTAATAGIYINTSGDLTQNGANSSGPATAQLNVEVPFMYMNFPATASPGESVTLSYTMTNNDRSNDATGISFTNDLNATLSGLAATALPATGFCGAGSTISGSSNISVANASITSGSSCTFSITVLIPSNAAAGSYTNNSSTINLTLGSATTKAAVSNTLVVKKAPLITALFIDDPVSAGQDVTLRYTITNTDSANAVSAITFTENVNLTLDAFTVKTLPPSNSCGAGSTVTNSTLDSSLYFIKLSNGNIAAGGSCTFDVVLTVGADAQPGSYAFTTSALTATVSGSAVNGSAAADTLVVVAAPSLSVSITESSAIPGSTVTAQFTLNYNANASADVTGVGFTLDLNAALNGLASTTATQNDICGSGSSFSGTTTLTLAGASLSPDGSCTFSVTLQIPSGATPGTITATSSTVSGTTSGKSVSSAAASDTLIISGLSFTSVYIDDPVLPSGTVTIRYTITNAATALAATALSFSHSLSSVLSSLTATNSLPSTPCGAGSTIAGTTNLSFSGGSLQPGSSCSFDVTASIPAGATAGNYASTTSALAATVNGNNTSTAAATDTLTVETLTVNLSTTASNPTSTSPIPVKIDFNRAVSNFADSDFVVGNGTAGNLQGSGLSYTVDITPTTSGTITVDLPANAVDDAVTSSHKNPAATQLSITYTATPATPTPTLAIAASSATKTNTGPVTYGVTYTNAETVNLTTASITLNKTGTANATVSVTGGTTSTPTISLGSITGDGTLGVSIAASTARNGTENSAAAGPSGTFTVDNTKPTITISDTVATSVSTPFTATFTFSEAVSNFVLGDITVTNASLSSFTTVSSTVYTALVTPTNQGAVTLDVAAGVADDHVSNTNTAATQHSVIYDTVAPSISITGPTTPVNAAFTATFTFNEDVTGFVVGDIVATNASLSNFAATNAKVYTATVTPTSNGTVSLDVAANVAIDAASNNNTAATQYSVTYDNVQPTVVISSPGAITNAAFTATFTFSEDVTGFINTDITASNAQLKTFNATSAKVYTIIVTPTSDGPVTLNVAANVATDAAGNNNTAASQLSVTYDATKPNVVISGPNTAVNAAFTATFTFSEDVTGFVVGDIDPFNATLSNFSATSAKVYTATVTPTTDGTVTLNVAADKVIDTANNGNSAATQYSAVYDATKPSATISATATKFNAPFTATIVFTEDVTGFVISDITANNASLSSFSATNAKQYSVLVTPTAEGNVTLDIAQDSAVDSANNGNNAAIQLTVGYDLTKPTVVINTPTGPLNAAFTANFTFSEDVTNFVIGDITVSNATLSNFVTTSAKVYTATVTPTTNGPVTIDVAAGAAQDTATNTNSAATQVSVTYDNISPTLTIVGPTAPVKAGFTATFTFSEDVSGFTLADITATNASVADFVTTSAKVYTAKITPLTDGNVTVNVASGAATDSATNANLAATQYSVVYDITAPTLTISSATSAVNAAFVATFTFSEDVSGFTVTDITAGNATLSNFSATSAKVYSATVTPTAQNNVTLNVAAGVAFDIANNGNAVASQYTVLFDSIKPDIVISAAAGPLNADFTATFTFTEDVTGFALSDITASNASLSNFVTTSAKVYTAKISPSSDGQVTLNVAANVAVDVANNGNTVATQYTVQFDNTLPTLAITGPVGPVNAAFTATFTFSEDVSGFTIADIVATNADLSGFVTTNAKAYSVQVAPKVNGSVTVNVAANVAQDSAGNQNTAAAQYSLTFDKELPGVVITGPTAPVNAAFTATFTFSKTVTNFAQDKIVVTNAVLSDFNAQSAPVYTAKVTPSAEGSVTLLVNAGTVTDPAGNTNGESNTLSLTYDVTKPTVQTLSPANAAVDITTTPTLIMTFNEPVTAGDTDNSIIIKDLATNTVMETIAANTTAVSIASNIVTVTLAKTYSEYTNYYVTIGSGAFVDVANNHYDGISSNAQWQFRIINLPPVTAADRFVVNEDSSIKSRVLSNDDGKNSQLNPASLLVKVQPSHGKTSVNSATGAITYQPVANFNGSDSFTYMVSDMIGTFSAETTVTVTVNPVNDSPIAIDDVVTTALNNQLTINALINDSDPDGSLNSEGLSISKQPLHGTAETINGQLFYNPASNYVGADSLQYTVVDNSGLSSNMATVYINVSGSNAAPVANADSASTLEDTAVTINVLSNDSDSDGQLVASSLTLVSQPSNGSANVQSDGSIIYTPASNYNGSDSFTYIVKDNEGANSAAATVSLSISSVNDAPEALSDNLILVDRVNSHWINILGNDFDVDGTITAINIISQPTSGSIQLDSTTLLLSYTASTGFSGSDSFSYQITDNNSALSAIATVTVGEGAVNDPPLANDDTVQTQEDQFIEIDVLANDEDIDGILVAQTLVITSNPVHGSTIIRQSDGVIFYSPSANYSGFDTFTYQVSDNNGATTTAKVNIQINSVNDTPVAISHSISTNEDSAVSMTLTATDGDNDTVSYHLVRRPSKGTLSGTAPTLSYQPNSNYNGNDSFTYYVNDGTTDSAVASVSITINPVNDQPTATSLEFQLVEDVSQTIILSGSDIDNDTLSYVIKNAPVNGVLTGNGANRVYTPNANFAGNDSFSYVVNDGTVDSTIATVSLTVSAINDAPVAANQSATTLEDTTLNITVAATDVDSQALSYLLVTPPQNGTLAGTLPNVQYVPQANFNGSDSFTFRASDGSLNSNLAKVSISVTAVNDVPVATAQSVTTREDQALFLTLTAQDLDNNALTYQVTTAPTKGQLTGTAPNLVYTPNTNFNGTDKFSFRANDGTINSATADISITVTPVNDLPVAVDDSGTLNSGLSLAIDVLANDSDVDGDTLKIIGATAAAGTVTFTDTLLTYQSLSGFKGDTVVNYTIADNQGGTASAKVLLQVNPASGSNVIAINVPADIEVDAQGLFTKVDLGVATASDSQGTPLAVTLLNQNNRFRPGINTVYWQASDSQGNTVTATQQVKINPIVSIDSDQIIREGNNAKITVHLNGQAPQYPVIVPYTVSGTATGALDHDLADGEVIITTGTEGVITVNLFEDTEAEGNESLIIALDPSLNIGEKQRHTITLSEQPQIPSVNFKVTQAQRNNVVVSQDQGEVDIQVELSQIDSERQFNYQWSSTDTALTDMLSNSQHIHIDPAQLAIGTYTIDLKVQDQSNDLLQTQQQLTIKVQAKAATLGSDDSDNDGISDIVEGLADDDNDGIANYLDAMDVACNVMPASLTSNNNHLIESQSGVCLKLGAAALARGDNSPRSLDVGTIGGVFDLLIDQLPITAQSHQLVLPLNQPLAAGAHYRRQLPAGQWVDFVEDADNQIRSAAGASGYCPSPGSQQWQAGLNVGHWCIQLSIKDGGANDNDGQANRTIAFKGAVYSASNNRQPQVNDDSAQTRSNESLTLDVLANDSDIDGDSLTITSATAAFGEVAIVNNKLLYQPLQGLLGQDTVNYGISDGKGGSGSANVTINLVANRLPQAVDDQAFVDNNVALIIDVLANDSDEDNDNLQLLSASSENGSVTITSDNRLSYRANSSFVGQDEVEYQISDGFGGQATGQLIVTVSAAPPAPTTNPPVTPTTPAPQANNSQTGSGGGAMLWLWVLCLTISLRRRGR